MLIGEHTRTARHFLTAGDSEIAAGDVLQGCEKLWGAASHAIIALAQQRVWPHGRHGAMRAAALALANEVGDGSLVAGFKAAEKLHANFYHGFMDNHQINEGRARVHNFVNRVLAIIDADN